MNDTFKEISDALSDRRKRDIWDRKMDSILHIVRALPSDLQKAICYTLPEILGFKELIPKLSEPTLEREEWKHR